MNDKIKNLHGKEFTVNAFGNTWRGKFELAQYREGNRACLSGISLTKDRVPFFTLTVNIPEIPLEEDEIIVKTWSENEEIANELLRWQDYFEDTGKRVPTGYVQAQIWKVL